MAARDIQFVIKARDEASRAFDTIANAMAELLGAQNQLAAGGGKVNQNLSSIIQTLGRFDSVSKQIFESSDRAGSAFEQQAAKVAGLEAKLANLKKQAQSAAGALDSIKGAAAATGGTADPAAVKAVETAQKALQRQIQSTTKDLTNQRTTLDELRTEAQKLASLANATEAAAPGVANAQQQAKAAEAMQQQVAAAQRIRDTLNPALAIQKRYAAEIAAVQKNTLLTDKERIAATKLLNAEMQREIASAGRGEGGRPSLFGLKPYELTNLGYQVNDIVSGLASGQSIMQIIAQQGGQVLQLMPRLGASVLAALTNPAILLAAAPFAAIAYAVKQAADQAERLRAIGAVLTATADGARYSAEAINDTVKALENYHLSASDAVTISKTFIKEGLDPSKFEAFGMAAKDMSRVFGTDVKKAAEDLATAFTGGYAAIAKFDDENNILSASQRETVRQLMETGHQAEAQKVAFDALQKKIHAAAEETKGPWTQAMDRFGTSWERTKHSLADSAFANTFLNFLNGVAISLQKIADLIDWINHHKLVGPFAGATISDQQTGTGISGGNVNSDLAARFTADRTATTQAHQKEEDSVKHEIDLQRELADATSTTDKIRITGEQAYKKAMDETGDATIAAMRRDQARADVIRELTRAQNSSVLSSAESYIGRNPDRTADKAVLGGLFSAAGIHLDPEKLAWCAAFVNAVLYSRGIPGTGSNLAASFKNFGTPTNQPEKGDIVLLKGHVGFFEGFTENGNVRVLGGNQDHSRGAVHGDVSVETFKRSSVLGFRRAPLVDQSQGLQDQIQKEQQLAAAQAIFDQKLDESNDKRERAAQLAKDELGATVQQRYELEKQHAIDEAIAQAADQAANSGLAFDPNGAKAKAIRETVAAEYDAAHAEQLINDKLREQQDLRDALLQGIQDAEQRGDTATVDRLKKSLDDMKPAMESAIDDAIKFYSQFDTPAAHTALENLRRLKQQVDDTAASLKQLDLQRLQQQSGGLEGLQGSLQNQVGLSQVLGDRAGARQAEENLTNVTAALIAVRQQQIAIYMDALQNHPEWLAAWGKTPEEIEATVAALQQANMESAAFGRQFLMTGKQINEMLADDMVSAVENFFNLIKQGHSDLSSLGIAFAQMTADILKQLGEMILKQALFNMLSANSQSGGGGVGGSIAAATAALFPAAITLNTAGGTLTAAGGILTTASAEWAVTAGSLMAAAQMLMVANSMSAGMMHGGGSVGAPSMRRAVSPLIFAGAARYHTGGMAGLRPNEVPTILERGEEVLTKSNPRHRMNRGKGGRGMAGAPNLKQVLVFDEKDIASAMASSAGEKVFLTFLSRRRGAARQALGVDS